MCVNHDSELLGYLVVDSQAGRMLHYLDDPGAIKF